jgi:uncharacterized protein YndB with AHSA1/START domain
MLANITKKGAGYTAKFERHWNHPVKEVWSYLTDNERLPLWFPELRAEELQVGGSMKFLMPDGNNLTMAVSDYMPMSVLQFAWGADQVRFELAAEPRGCRLLLIEQITEITSYTPKDLAGWHVCLDVVGRLMDGVTTESRKLEWEGWYEQYKQLITKLKQGDRNI